LSLSEQLRRDVLRDTVAAPLPSKGHVRPAWVRVLKAAVSPVDVLCAWMVARPSRVRFACALAILTIVIGAGTWLHFRQSKAGEIGRFAAVVGAPKVHRVGKRSTLNAQRSTVVHLGDRIETGDADRAEIQFRDGTTLRLNFNTTLEIPKSEIRNPKSEIARRHTSTLQRFNASTAPRSEAARGPRLVAGAKNDQRAAIRRPHARRHGPRARH